MVELQVLSLSPAAKHWLENSSHGRVLHVFDPVCNLINEESAVLSLVSTAIGNGPFSAVVERGGFTSWLDSQSAVQFSQSNLILGDAIFNFEEAQGWEPRPQWESLHGRKKEMRSASKRIESLLRLHAPAESFAHIVFPPASMATPHSPVFSKARSNIDALLPALIREDAAEMRRAAALLAGLGAGLTPAGDDFLLGLMHALWATRPQTQALALCLILEESAAPRTNSLSAAWLQAAARGEAGEPWHELFAAISGSGEAEKATENAVMRILPTGHSSGADALGAFAAFIQKDAGSP